MAIYFGLLPYRLIAWLLSTKNYEENYPHTPYGPSLSKNITEAEKLFGNFSTFCWTIEHITESDSLRFLKLLEERNLVDYQSHQYSIEEHCPFPDRFK